MQIYSGYKPNTKNYKASKRKELYCYQGITYICYKSYILIKGKTILIRYDF